MKTRIERLEESLYVVNEMAKQYRKAIEEALKAYRGWCRGELPSIRVREPLEEALGKDEPQAQENDE